MEQLEKKIREALPRLKELTKGCLLGYDGENIDIEIINTNKNIVTYIDAVNIDKIKDASFEEFSQLDMSIIGHPIKLNDVLEYIKIKDTPIYNTTQVDNIAFGVFPKIQYWNLSSVYLKDQSNELKQFLNEL